LSSEETKESGGRKGISRRRFIAVAATGVAAGAAVGVAGGYLGAPKTTSTATSTATSTVTQTVTTPTTLTSTTTQTVTQVPAAQYVNFTVNGQAVQLQVGVDVKPWNTLADTLRENLGLTGTKVSCNMGACGRCTVLADGTPVLSCSTLAMDVDGKKVVTIEGLQDPATGKLHAVQQAFVNVPGSMQCGYCTPAMILAAKALLDKKPSATRADIVDALSGVVCRCGAYKHISDAVILAETYH
jgi:aerobic-type carbon monoxide dehydrogenase small subunit (CoxS/CutS family)